MMPNTNLLFVLLTLLPTVICAMYISDYIDDNDDYMRKEKRFPAILTCQTDLDCATQRGSGSCCVVSRGGQYRECSPLGTIGATCNVHSFQHPWIGQRSGQLCPCGGQLRCARKTMRLGSCELK